MSDKGYSQHTDPLFSKLGMLNLSDIHKHNASTFMYKYIKEKLPSSFNGMFAPFVDPNRTQNMKIYLASKYKEFKCKNRNCYSCNLKIF